MSNSQFGFDTSITSGSPYGMSVTFTVPSGIDTIASKASGCWCSGGNLLVYDSNGNYIECSLTYVSKTSGQGCSGGIGVSTIGWYFWYGYNGSGSYIKLPGSPQVIVGDSVTFTLQYNGTNWEATLTDHTHSANNQLASFSGTIAGFVITSSNMWFENGGDTNCCDYSSSFGGMTFSSLTFYNQSGSTITCGASISGLIAANHNQPSSNCAGTKTTCITQTVNTSTYVLATNG